MPHPAAYTVNPSEPAPQPAGELRIFIGGSAEDFYVTIVTHAVEKHLGDLRVSVQIIDELRSLLDTAAQSPPDLFMLYLYFGDPADGTVADLATCRAEIRARLADAADQPCWVTSCGLGLVTYLRAEFNQPVIVLTGSPESPGRATRVGQSGGTVLLPVPFSSAECAAAISTCLKPRPDAN